MSSATASGSLASLPTTPVLVPEHSPTIYQVKSWCGWGTSDKQLDDVLPVYGPQHSWLKGGGSSQAEQSWGQSLLVAELAKRAG